MKPKAAVKKRKVAKAPKTQQQTQRQSVIVNIGQPTRRRRAVRQIKEVGQAGAGQVSRQFPTAIQTYFIDRSPSEIILRDPFATGVIQKVKEEKVARQTTSVSTNNDAAARLPGIEETLIRGQESEAQTYATVLSRNPIGAPTGQFSPQRGRQLAPSAQAQIEAQTYGQYDPFSAKK